MIKVIKNHEEVQLFVVPNVDESKGLENQLNKVFQLCERRSDCGEDSRVGDLVDVEVEFRSGDKSDVEDEVEMKVVIDDVLQNEGEEELEVDGAIEVEGYNEVEL